MNILLRHGVGKYFLLQRLGSELIERQANPPFKSRLANALQSLTSSNQLSSSLDRVNYQRFRKNLTNFLIEVRGFLRTMWCVQSTVYLLKVTHLFSHSSAFARSRNLSIASSAQPRLSGDCIYYGNRSCNSVSRTQEFPSFRCFSWWNSNCTSSMPELDGSFHGSNLLTTDDNWLIACSSFFTASGVSFDIHHRIFGVNYGPFLNAKAALDYQNILSVAFSNI